jgi:hypothetical protein
VTLMLIETFDGSSSALKPPAEAVGAIHTETCCHLH